MLQVEVIEAEPLAGHHGVGLQQQWGETAARGQVRQTQGQAGGGGGGVRIQLHQLGNLHNIGILFS